MSPVTNAVEIVEYTKRGLSELLEDQRFWMQPRLPITRRRAVSQVANPRADNDDTVLIAAYSRDRLIAYVGILPDVVVPEGGQPIKFGWLTAWWVDKESEQRLAGMKVLSIAMKRYSNRLAASFPSAEAGSVYAGSRQFLECFLRDRCCFLIGVPPSIPVVSRLIGRLSGLKNRLLFKGTLEKGTIDIQAIKSFNVATESFINRQALDDPLKRDITYWNWALRFPWMTASKEDEVDQRKYYFSVFARDFRQLAYVVRQSGSIIGFMVITLRDGRLCLKHAYYDRSYISDVAAATSRVVAEVNPWLFICADAALNAEFRKGVRFYWVRQYRSTALYAAKTLPAAFTREMQLGLGDSMFT